MPDIQYFQGGYEEQRHERVLFGLLGGHDETHIHFNATSNAPARDVWEKHNQVLGGLLGKSHDLHVHQDANAAGSGETDLRVHDGAILGGLILDERHSDFKTQRVTAQGTETRESHDSYSASVGGMLGQNHNTTDTRSFRDNDGYTTTETKQDSGGSILGGIIGESSNKTESTQVTTPDGKSITTHYKSDTKGEALCGIAAEGQCHTEYVDNGDGPIGVTTYRGSVLGGVAYMGDHAKVFGADKPGASQYLEMTDPYGRAIPSDNTPELGQSSYTDDAPAAIGPASDVARPGAQGGDAQNTGHPGKPAESPQPKATSQAGDLSEDGYLGQAHQQIVKNFNDPDTAKPIAEANILKFDNGDYFVADGNNVRMVDAHNHRVNFVSDGKVAVAQGPKGNDMVVDPATNKEVPRLVAKMSNDGRGVEFDFANGLSVSATKNGDYVVKDAKAATASTDADSGSDDAPVAQPAQKPVPAAAK